MKLSLNKLAENLIWLLTVFILTTYIVFEMKAWGRYAYFGASVSIALLSAFLHKGRITIKMVPMYGFMLMFIAYTALSAVWAINPGDAITKAVTLFSILLCNMMLYVHYQYQSDVEKLLRAVMWAGYLVTIYAIVFYGLDAIILATRGGFIENEFSNINTIGMTAATACIIQVHEFQYKKSRKSVVLMIPCVVVIAATQSRKALLLLLLGMSLVYFLKQRESHNFYNQITKGVFTVTISIGILIVLYNLPIFEGVRNRVDRMILGFLGKTGADSSTLLRRSMINLGWEWFLKYPVGGVGMGNPHILSAEYLSANTYLHNNYVELLCGGGMFGFCIYYSMHIYILRELWIYRNADRKMFEMCFVWLCLILILDYGMVSYYSKSDWFELLIHFINVANLKQKAKINEKRGCGDE